MKKILILICTLLCANVLFAQIFFYGGLQYEVTSTNPPEAMVYDHPSTYPLEGNVVIPTTVISQGTTYSVTSIGNRAFYGCSGLTSITIPNGVTSIGDRAFRGCSSLTSVTCLRSNSPSLGIDVFYGTPNNKILTVPCGYESEYNDWQTTIWASIDCIVTIGSRFTIGDLTYEITSETEVKVYYANSSITTANIPETVTYQGTTYSVTSIGFWSFSDCSSLTSVDIPNSVTTIEIWAFLGCSSLTSVTIPNSVISIGDAAFGCCSSLTSVTIPNGVTSIGEDAFFECSSLTSMTIDMSNIPNLSNIGLNSILQNLTFGENVTSIASGAFNGCSFLQNVTCLATNPPTLEDNTVFPNPNTATLIVPCGSSEAYSTSTWNMFFSGRISENGYNVEVSVNDETFGSVAVESDCSTGTLTANANEGYRFVIWNDGNTDNPRTVALTSDTAFTAIFALIDESSLAEDAEFAEISLYPNPTSSKVSFNQTIEKVEVIDLSGKTLFTFSNANSINIESLPSGAYYLRLTNNDKAIMQKIIKE